MKQRPVRIRELALVMMEKEREELGRDAPVHVIRNVPMRNRVSPTACGHVGKMQLFLPFLWFMTKNPNACKKCLEKTLEIVDKRDL